MKKINLITLLFCLSVFLSSCSVVGGIFKAGVWVGIFIVVVIVAVIIFLITRASNKG